MAGFEFHILNDKSSAGTFVSVETTTSHCLSVAAPADGQLLTVAKRERDFDWCPWLAGVGRWI